MDLTGIKSKKVFAIVNQPTDFPDGKRVIFELTCNNDMGIRVEQFIPNADLAGLSDTDLRDLAWGRFTEAELQGYIDATNAKSAIIGEEF